MRSKWQQPWLGLIESKIHLDWSSEQVSDWLEKDQSIRISHECIYQHIWTDKGQEGELFKHLRQSNKKRKKQYGSKDKRGQIRNRISIDEDPEDVEAKIRIDDQEIDTVIGKNYQGTLVTLVDPVLNTQIIEGSQQTCWCRHRRHDYTAQTLFIPLCR